MCVEVQRMGLFLLEHHYLPLAPVADPNIQAILDEVRAARAVYEAAAGEGRLELQHLSLTQHN
jgi:hypothetical protein